MTARQMRPPARPARVVGKTGALGPPPLKAPVPPSRRAAIAPALLLAPEKTGAAEEEAMKALFNLALLLVLLLLVFTDAGRDLAAEVLWSAHEQLTAYITQALQDPPR